jgi:hypothetical protein
MRDEAFAERLAAYLAGALEPDERAAFEREALADPERAEELYAATGLDAEALAACGGPVTASGTAVPGAGPVADQTASPTARPGGRAAPPPAQRRRAGSGWRRRALLVALPVAAILAVVIVRDDGGGRDEAPHPPVLRSADETVVGLDPRGELLAPPRRFVWTSVRGADRYRFALHDAAGELLHVAVVTDTVLTVANVAFPPAVAWNESSFFWQVVPLRANGREGRASATIPFWLTTP